MATVQALAVINRASILLQDSTNVRWPLAELLDWLNDGQRDVALYKPNSCVRNIDVVLKAGTKQSIPDDGNSLIDVPRNTNGHAVRITSREVLDAQVPDWHVSSRASPRVQHYCYTSHDPKNFYVYPPSPGGNSIEMIYSASPTNATLVSVISIDDIYASALVDYLMYRAYSKDIEYAINVSSAASHRAAFMEAMRGKATAEMSTNPNAQSGNPNIV